MRTRVIERSLGELTCRPEVASGLQPERAGQLDAAGRALPEHSDRGADNARGHTHDLGRGVFAERRRERVAGELERRAAEQLGRTGFSRAERAQDERRKTTRELGGESLARGERTLRAIELERRGRVGR